MKVAEMCYLINPAQRGYTQLVPLLCSGSVTAKSDISGQFPICNCRTVGSFQQVTDCWKYSPNQSPEVWLYSAWLVRRHQALFILSVCLPVTSFETDRPTDRQTDRQTDRHTVACCVKLEKMCSLDSVETVRKRTMFAKITSIMDKPCHPLHEAVGALSSSSSQRLKHPRCKECFCRSFILTAIRLYNAS